MFQLNTATRLLLLGSTRQCIWPWASVLGWLEIQRRDDECVGTSKFSYSSEILEKHWEPNAEDGGNDWLKGRAAFRLRI